MRRCTWCRGSMSWYQQQRKEKGEKTVEKTPSGPRMREINDLEAVSKASVDLKIIGQIFRKDMSEFLDFLSDENGPAFSFLCSKY